MEGKRGSECLLKSVSNIDFNPNIVKPPFRIRLRSISNIRINLRINLFKLVLTSNIAIKRICFKAWIVIQIPCIIVSCREVKAVAISDRRWCLWC